MISKYLLLWAMILGWYFLYQTIFIEFSLYKAGSYPSWNDLVLALCAVNCSNLLGCINGKK